MVRYERGWTSVKWPCLEDAEYSWGELLDKSSFETKPEATFWNRHIGVSNVVKTVHPSSTNCRRWRRRIWWRRRRRGRKTIPISLERGIGPKQHTKTWPSSRTLLEPVSTHWSLHGSPAFHQARGPLSGPQWRTITHLNPSTTTSFSKTIKEPIRPKLRCWRF